MTRVTLDPSAPFFRHPLRPHELPRARNSYGGYDSALPPRCATVEPRRLVAVDRRTCAPFLAAYARRPQAATADGDHQHSSVLRESDAAGNADAPHLQHRVGRRSACRSAYRLSARTRGAVRVGERSGLRTFEGAKCEAYVKDLPLDRVASDVLIAYEMNPARRCEPRTVIRRAWWCRDTTERTASNGCAGSRS